MQRLIVGALVVVLLIAGGIALFPRLVPEHEVRAAVTRSLQRATGVEPRISGEVRLTLLPRPAIRLEQVRLDDGERAGITAGSLVATIRLLPLFYGSIEIAAITFERPRLALEIGTNGIRIAGLPLYPQAPIEERVRSPELRIVDGVVELRTADAEAFDTLTAVEASLAWSSSGLTASGTFEWRRMPVAATLVVADIAALRSGARSGLRLRLEAERLRLGFEGGLAFRNGPQAEGVLAADGKSLRVVLSGLGLDPLTLSGFGPFALKGQIALTPSALAFSGLSIELDGNIAEGGLSLKRDGERVLLQGTLASETLDLTRYSRLTAPGSPPASEWLDRSIDFAALERLDLDLRLSAKRVQLENTELSRVALAVAVKAGRLTLAVGEAQVFGGTLQGTAAIARGEAGMEVKIDASLANFNLERGLGELAGIRRLEGTGTLTVVLESVGTSFTSIWRDLAGQATLVVTAGTINGINVEQVLRRLERKPLSGFADLRGGRTPFDRFAVTMRIGGGTATLDDVRIESPLVRVTLTGATSLTRRDFELRGTASLVRPAAVNAATRGLELPFLLRGPWDNPYLLPDVEALIQYSGAAAPLLDAARGKIPRGTVRSVIESITGRQPEAPPPAEPATPSPAAPPR